MAEPERHQTNDDETREYASPACSLHEIDPAYSGIPAVTAEDAVYAWRTVQRQKLIEERMALPQAAGRAGELARAPGRAVHPP